MKHVLLASVLLIIGAMVVHDCRDYTGTVATRSHLNTGSNFYKDQTGEPFVNGDTLYPSYACPDTLIIINADKLNWIFDGVATPAPASDSQIDSVLHLYCLPVGVKPMRDYQIEITRDSTYIYDGNRLVSSWAVNWDNPNKLDSLLISDNQ